jgi:conjugal transfer pilus assembly protein TraF
MSIKKSQRLALGALAMVVSGQAWSQVEDQNKDEFFKDKADGWHWYEDPPIEEEEEEVEEELPIQLVAPASTEAPEPLSAEWIRTTLPMLRDAAIDNPTRTNVSAYFYAQRIMMDKAQIFSDMAREVVTTDPLLDENLRLPFASAAKVSYLQSAKAAKGEIIDMLAEESALWLFYDENCSYCKDQINPINTFAKKHALTIEVVHKQGGQIDGLDPSIRVRRAEGHFERLGINFTPAVVMVTPPDNLWVISQGFTAYTSLVDRVIAAANRFGLISEEEYMKAVPTSRGVLRAESVNESEAVDWDSPDEWVPYVQDAIRQTYGLEYESQGDEDDQ